MKTLVTHPNFSQMGNDIIHGNGSIELAKLRFETFPDGWPNYFIEDAKNKIEHKDVTYIGDFSRPEYLVQNYFAIRGLLDYYADKVRVIVPYFPVGTMERISKKGEIATAPYFADILSHMPPGRSEKTSLHTFDIHALSERFFFDPFKVNMELHSTMRMFRQSISGNGTESLDSDIAIAFPDDGAAKRFQESFEGCDTIVCAKIRNGDERSITVKEGSAEGKRVFIVDDLIQTGGTIREAADVLRKSGAKSVSAFAPHGVFPNGSHIRLAESLDELIVTDSIPENIDRAKSVGNMRILSIASLVEKIVSRGT